ncbi:YciI family protein [Streptomyces sp. NPDC088810]|uniref:YciI family protein n=1 Tax=Streptomyces sp. NPDC088810 TaxID=3365904 RepID=UPI003800EF2D
MRFAIVVIENDASRRSIQDDRLAYRKKIEAWMGEQAQAGVLVGGEAFETEVTPPVTVRRAADGTTEVTEGPFATGQETLGGYLRVEVADRPGAVDVARTWPTPETLEVRPLWTAG